jgi:hypothetical protein
MSCLESAIMRNVCAEVLTVESERSGNFIDGLWPPMILPWMSLPESTIFSTTASAVALGLANEVILRRVLGNPAECITYGASALSSWTLLGARREVQLVPEEIHAHLGATEQQLLVFNGAARDAPPGLVSRPRRHEKTDDRADEAAQEGDPDIGARATSADHDSSTTSAWCVSKMRAVFSPAVG